MTTNFLCAWIANAAPTATMSTTWSTTVSGSRRILKIEACCALAAWSPAAGNF